MQKQYEKKASIPLCKFDAGELVQLGHVITEDVSNISKPVSVDVTLHDGSTKLPDYSEFPEHEELLQTMQGASFRAKSTDVDENFSPLQYVNVHLEKTYILLTVEGVNENWVIGNFERIKAYLHTKRPSLWYRVARILYLPTYLLSGVLCFINVTAALTASKYFWVSAILFLGLQVSSASLLKRFIEGRLLPHTVFVSSSGNTGISPVDRMKILLALLTLIVAVVAMVIATLPLFFPLPLRHP